jgi:hypothetical protein
MEDYSVSPAGRAAAYWFADGLPEIVCGLVMILCGGLGFALWSVGLSPLWSFPGLLLLWKDRDIIEFLKAHLTYPRTGYVRPPMNSDDAPPRTVGTLMSLSAPVSDRNVTHFRNNTAIPLSLAAFWTGLTDQTWIWPVTVCAAVVAMYALNRRLERPYRWWEMVPLALAGSALMLSNLPRGLRPSPALALAGAWLLALGGGKLVWYLHGHPRPDQEGARA